MAYFALIMRISVCLINFRVQNTETTPGRVSPQRITRSGVCLLQEGVAGLQE